MPSDLTAQRFLRGLYPNEVHSLPGDCINPKCDYVFTDADKAEISLNDGWFTCPKCRYSYDYYYDIIPGRGGYTLAGLTMKSMGDIGEKLIEEMHNVPQLGTVTWISEDINDPLDAIIGPFGVEIKTNHSQAQPRFKITGTTWDSTAKQKIPMRRVKLQECANKGLRPAIVGVRLNFYNDQADIFVRPDSMSDSWIGVPGLSHVATVDFEHLNPFKDPHKVPPPDKLPEDDDTPAHEEDLPF
jgi:hypothetical protein